MEKKVKIIIADDHPFVRSCVAKAVKKHAKITFLEEADNGIDLLKRIEEKQPDLAVIDLSMPGKDGYSAIYEIHTKYPQIKIIAFSGFLTPENQNRAISLGAHSSISKTESTKAIGHAIKSIVEGHHYHSDVSSILDIQTNNTDFTPLTKREQQVAELVVQGKSSKEISSMFNISSLTVDKHRANIKQKLGAKNVAEMVLRLSKK